MGFKEDLQKLSLQVMERRTHIINEEMTKQALIIPFLQVLGYDVFNPLEVRPEYVADFGKKKGEKVDYALFKDGTPVAFVEAKSVNENLLNHDAQLARYFNAVQEVKLGILTNGIEYKFFTDLTANNIMDETPFLTVNITSLSDSDIEALSRFRKDSFDKEYLIKYAEELLYTSALNDSLKELFKNPSDEFIKFLVRDFNISRVTTNVIDRFRPIVKKAISNAVIDIVSQGLYQQEAAVTKEEKEEEVQFDVATDDIQKKNIVTTASELKFFECVKEILQKAEKNITEIVYKDTTNYFSINYKNTSGWFIRVNLDSSTKSIMTRINIQTVESLVSGFKIEPAPKGQGETRIIINSHEDVKKLDKLIIKCFEEVSNS